MRKITYWNRYASPMFGTRYYTYKYKRVYPWTFLKLCYIKMFYDGYMEGEE